MKKLLAILILSGLAATASANDLMTIQIAMTESRFTNSVIASNRQDVLLDLWGKEDTPENRAWVDSGWSSNYRLVDDTNVTVYVYRITVLQAKQELVATLTPDERQRYKEWIEADPQVKASINRTPDNSLVLWRVEAKPEEGHEP